MIGLHRSVRVRVAGLCLAAACGSTVQQAAGGPGQVGLRARRAAGPLGRPQAAPGAAIPATGRGFDETTIKLGVTRLDDTGPVLGSLGLDVGTTTIDLEAAEHAIIDDINAAGGIGGRQIVLVEHQGSSAEFVASGVLSGEGIQDGFAALGSTLYSAMSWTSEITAGRHASVVAVRDMSFIPECTCYGYDDAVNHGIDPNS